MTRSQSKRKYPSTLRVQRTMFCQKLDDIYDSRVVKELEWSEIPEPNKEDIDMEKKIQDGGWADS